jgi:hypothetical protein
MDITPHLDGDLMYSFEVSCDGVTARVVLVEPLLHETDLERVSMTLLKGADVESVSQTRLNRKRSCLLSRFGYAPTKRRGKCFEPGNADTFIVSQAQHALDMQGVRGLAEFCAEQAQVIESNCTKPELAAA